MSNSSKLLSEHGIDPDTVQDLDVFERLEPELQEWWVETFGQYVPQNEGLFTPPQRQAIPHIDDGDNTLVASPTGSGKTLSSFSTVVSDLLHKNKQGTLENSVYCLYISPLKSLANDIHRNLEAPLQGVQDKIGEDQEIRHAIRHGDTPDKERRKMLNETPHILNTTPETLAILLNSPKFREKFSTLEYIIVDEIHSLADNKRGSHLSVSLERVENIAEQEPTRIGCSATVEPLETIGQFLSGFDNNRNPRDFEIVDTRFVRDYDLEVESPVENLIQTPSNQVSEAFYERLHEMIQNNSTTLIFTNTRSGAESTLGNLRSNYPEIYDESNSAAHHGSLSKDKREVVEKGLKNGEFKVVTTSTSLELGIDMQDIELVVQVGSPKSIAGLLQRIGRAGHQLGETVKGRVIALDRDELVECAVMADRAEEGYIDRVFVPEKPQDVAAQHVYGMAINGPYPKEEILQTLRRAYPYRSYGESEFDTLLRYLRADYDDMEDHNVYPKVWVDTNDDEDGEYHYDEYDVGTELIGRRGSQARVIYMTNIGTIPDSFTADVFTRNDEWVGDLDEQYLNTLEKGDVFQLGGDNYKYKYRRGSKVYVDRTQESPTVPSWFSERLPLSYDLANEVLEFQKNVVEHLEENGYEGVLEFLDDFPINQNAKTSLARLYEEQRQYSGIKSISTPTNLTIEEHHDTEENRRRYYVNTVYGREFNDGFSRLLAQYITEISPVNVDVAVSDHGFMLSVPENVEVDMADILQDIHPDSVERRLRDSLDDTDFLKRYFRINATRSLMILKRYKGYEKSAKEQQVKSEMMLSYAQGLDDFAVIEETYRELMEDKLNLDGLVDIVGKIHSREIDITETTVESPSPRAFGLATLSASDTVLADDESEVLRHFHDRVLEEVDLEDELEI